MHAVHLRPLEPADARVVASWALDPVFLAAADWSTRTIEEYVDFHTRLIADPPADLLRLGAVHDGDLVGYVDLHGREPHRRELGYVIGDSRRWGRGLGGLAARAALDYGFDRMGLTDIWAEALAANAASVRILQSLGMREIERGGEGVYLGTPTYFRRFTTSGQLGDAVGAAITQDPVIRDGRNRVGVTSIPYHWILLPTPRAGHGRRRRRSHQIIQTFGHYVDVPPL